MEDKKLALLLILKKRYLLEIKAEKDIFEHKEYITPNDKKSFKNITAKLRTNIVYIDCLIEEYINNTESAIQKVDKIWQELLKNGIHI